MGLESATVIIVNETKSNIVVTSTSSQMKKALPSSIPIAAGQFFTQDVTAEILQQSAFTLTSGADTATTTHKDFNWSIQPTGFSNGAFGVIETPVTEATSFKTTLNYYVSTGEMVPYLNTLLPSIIGPATSQFNATAPHTISNFATISKLDVNAAADLTCTYGSKIVTPNGPASIRVVANISKMDLVGVVQGGKMTRCTTTDVAVVFQLRVVIKPQIAVQLMAISFSIPHAIDLGGQTPLPGWSLASLLNGLGNSTIVNAINEMLKAAMGGSVPAPAPAPAPTPVHTFAARSATPKNVNADVGATGSTEQLAAGLNVLIRSLSGE